MLSVEALDDVIAVATLIESRSTNPYEGPEDFLQAPGQSDVDIDRLLRGVPTVPPCFVSVLRRVRLGFRTSLGGVELNVNAYSGSQDYVGQLIGNWSEPEPGPALEESRERGLICVASYDTTLIEVAGTDAEDPDSVWTCHVSGWPDHDFRLLANDFEEFLIVLGRLAAWHEDGRLGIMPIDDFLSDLVARGMSPEQANNWREIVQVELHHD